MSTPDGRVTGKKRPLWDADLEPSDGEEEFKTPITKRSRMQRTPSPFSYRSPTPKPPGAPLRGGTSYNTPVNRRRRNFSMGFPCGGTPASSFVTPPPRGARTQVKSAIEVAKAILNSSMEPKNRRSLKRDRPEVENEEEGKAKKQKNISEHFERKNFPNCRLEFHNTLNTNKFQ
ncbi:hypothetical protein BSKO_00064 [Bryopsis sp. KO-2023]|nr:hypothetical protein BSKO_00064 [Bryopsis sp. KO-2023]